MIPAKPSAWFVRFFAGHARSRIFGTFGKIHVRGLAELTAAVARGPVLVVANHSAWWDALVALWLSRRVARADAYAMMDATNLRRLPFFGKVGAFGVDLDDPRDGARAIRYAAKLLDRPGRLVWIFPEGRERSPFEPIELLAGAAAIARIAKPAAVLPIAIRYVFASDERPELWIAIGEPLRERGLEAQRDAITDERARIDGALKAPHDFTLVHAARPSIFARFAERALARFVRLL